MDRYKLVRINYQGAVGYLVTINNSIQQVGSDIVYQDLQQLIDNLQITRNVEDSRVHIEAAKFHYVTELIGEFTAVELVTLQFDYPELFV